MGTATARWALAPCATIRVAELPRLLRAAAGSAYFVGGDVPDGEPALDQIPTAFAFDVLPARSVESKLVTQLSEV